MYRNSLAYWYGFIGTVLVFLIGLLLCSCVTAYAGWRETLVSYVVQDFQLAPTGCRDLGTSEVCDRPDGSYVAINFTRDAANAAEATVIDCDGARCAQVYRIRCDLAGCQEYM